MASPSRRSGWIIASALAVSVLMTIAVVLWLWLPRWAPMWVVKHSPWFEPAYRAALHDPDPEEAARYQLFLRMNQEWEKTALATIRAEATGSDPVRRQHVVEILALWAAKSDNQAALTTLVTFMEHDPDPQIREMAISLVAPSDCRFLVTELIRMTKDPVGRVRAAALENLAYAYDPAATEVLVAALRDPDPRAVIAACLSLKTSSFDRRVVDQVLPLLEHTNPAIARAAWEAACSFPLTAEQTARLGRLPVATVMAWNAIRRLMSDERDFVVGRRWDQQALAWGEGGIPDLVAALANDQAEISECACRALVVVLAGERLREADDGTEGGWILRRSEQHDERNRTVAAALRRGVDVQAALLQAAASANGTLRQYAMIGLRGSDSDDTRSAAIRAVSDQNDNVVLEAALTLAVLHDGRAFAPLVRLLGEPGMTERTCAGLSVLAEQRAIDPLIKALTERGRPEAAEAAVALGEVGDLRAIEPLIHALNSVMPKIRAAAALALGKLGDWRATPALIDVLKFEDADTRRLTIMGLHLLRDPRAVEPLIARLDDPDAEVRQQAVLALRILRDPRAVEPLIRRLTDTDHVVVMYAVNTLAELGDPRVVDFLLPLLDHPGSYSLPWVVEALAMVPLTEEQRSRLCSPARDPDAVTSSAAPAAPGSTPPRP